MNRHIDIDKEKVIGLLGKTCDRELAEKFNVSIAWIQSLRKKLNIEPYRKFRKKDSSRFKLVSLTDEEIFKEYKATGSFAQVARKYGCSRQAVHLRVLRYRRSINEI